jgi:DAACS family dicarboxylate/amino acid:cation (Na+ or H+) symporter
MTDGNWYTRAPLYVRIIIGLSIGAMIGAALHLSRAGPGAVALPGMISGLILKLLGALAPPLILIAVLDTLIKARLAGGVVPRMIFLLILNTLVAIGIGLLVANVIQPGTWADRSAFSANTTGSSKASAGAASDSGGYPISALLDNIPDSLLKPLVDNNVIGVILIGAGFGVALRRLETDDREVAERMVGVAFKAITIVLHWVIELVPIGVMGIVATEVGTHGLGAFKALFAFVLAVVVGLLLQLAYYLARIGLGTWVRPWNVLAGMRDAIVMAFSTDSSTATMPVTYRCLKDNVDIREESARMGALVGTNFNNDGTALYEAMAALFISQLLGRHLSIGQQILVVLTSIVASVGAAGIPEAGIVTMALVFSAVGLPKEYIGLLLTVDWFLDRCRTVVNMMGDVNVSCMLDGRRPAASGDAAFSTSLATAARATNSSFTTGGKSALPVANSEPTCSTGIQ